MFLHKSAYCTCIHLCPYLLMYFLITNLRLLQFVLPGPDCSTGSACLPSTGAVCGGKQRRLHQWQHVSQSVSQPCSYTPPQILALRLCSLFFLLLSLFTPSFMSQAHDGGGSVFRFFVFVFFSDECAIVCLIVLSHLNMTRSRSVF